MEVCRQEDSCGGTETNQSRQVHGAEDREETNLALLTGQSLLQKDQEGLRRDMQACPTGFKWEEVRPAPSLLAQVRPWTLFQQWTASLLLQLGQEGAWWESI